MSDENYDIDVWFIPSKTVSIEAGQIRKVVI